MDVGLPMAMGASLIAGLAAGLGGLAVAALPRPSEKTRAVLMGFGAGVMLAASAFSLLGPAIAIGGERGGPLWGALQAAGGLLSGAALVGVLNRLVPHEHFWKGLEGPAAAGLRRAWLFVAAIAIHNLPEGLAMGVGFATGDLHTGVPLTVGIALHNLPEGLIVAAALVGEGYRAPRAVRVALLTGLVEPLAAVPGYLAVAAVTPLLPWGLGLAAGAMLYVVSNEVIPESHRGEGAIAATWGIVAGFALMMVLDQTVGG